MPASPDDASEVDTLPTLGGLCTSAATTTPPRAPADQVVDGLTKVLRIPIDRTHERTASHAIIGIVTETNA